MDKKDSSKIASKMLKLESFNIRSIDELINESIHAFLAPLDNPGQTAQELFDHFETDHIFQIFGYVKNDKPISYIVMIGHKDPKAISIGPMYVSADNRGQGLGKKQVIEFIDYARKSNFTSIYTRTWLGNKASRGIFESLGFKTEGVKEGDRINGDSTIIYKLEL